MVFHLSPWAKVLAMALGAASVAVAVTIVVCFLGPGCFFYRYLHTEEEKEYEKKRAKKMVKTKKGYLAANLGQTLGQMSYGSNGVDVHKNSHGRLSRLESTVSSSSTSGDSTYSSLSEGAAAAADQRSSIMWTGLANEHHPRERPEEEEEEERKDSLGGSVKEAEDGGELTLSVLFTAALSPCDKTGGPAQGQLRLEVVSAQGLPQRDYLGACDPYTVLQVWSASPYPLRPWKSGESGPWAEFRTNTLRRTRDPLFAQTFQLQLPPQQLKNQIVTATVYDQNHFAQSVPMAKGQVSLQEKQTLLGPEKVTFTIPLKRVHRDCGEILFGLTYLPTAERLTFCLMKANNLQYQTVVPNLKDFQPYVRVTMLNSSGRAVKKKKSDPQACSGGSCSPRFQETLVFDFPSSLVNSTTFVLCVCCKAPGAEENAAEHCIGFLALGYRVRGSAERTHFRSVLESPRKTLARCHRLK